MRSDRQLGLLWGGVALLLLAVAPLGERLASQTPRIPTVLRSSVYCLRLRGHEPSLSIYAVGFSFRLFGVDDQMIHDLMNVGDILR